MFLDKNNKRDRLTISVPAIEDQLHSVSQIKLPEIKKNQLNGTDWRKNVEKQLSRYSQHNDPQINNSQLKSYNKN